MNTELTEIKLSCGITLKNRIAKASMSENMANKNNLPAKNFCEAYSTWSHGGAGMLITGHVMVDRNHISEARNVILDEKSDLSFFTNWAKSGKKKGTSLWMQINHPGKQIPKFINKEPVAPSALAFPSPMNKMFNTPKALTEEEIFSIIKKFATTAKLAKQAGFDGVQIHSAHGYLVSQFLSPKHNQREDQWGGSLENRMRFLLSIYQEIRKEVGPHFGVSIKLNSADFQRGGFTEEESLKVLQELDQLESSVDFIEISGGSYEAPVMVKGQNDQHKKKSTLEREAYFLQFAEQAKVLVKKTPLMLTGGFRTSEGIRSAISESKVDLVGIGRPFAVFPDLVKQDLKSFHLGEKKTGIKFVDAIIPLEITWYTQQIQRMGKKKKTVPHRSVYLSALQSIYHQTQEILTKK